MAASCHTLDEVDGDRNYPHSMERLRTPSPLLSKSSTELSLKSSHHESGDFRKHSPPNRMRRVHNRLKDWGWFWETLSCILMIGLCGAIVGVLAAHDNGPVPDLPYGITLNALISIFVTAMGWAMTVILQEGLGQLKWTWFRRPRPLKDIVMFDEASRDALGSARLFLHEKPIHLASLGAALALLSLMIGPFVQQVIQQTPQLVVVNSQATMPLCGSHDYQDPAQGTPMIEPEKLTLQSMGAIYVGMFQSAENESISARCPTGNCAFETYQSFGFCSKCADLTDKIQKSSECSKRDTTGCQYTLPNKSVSITENPLQTKMVSTTSDSLIALPDLPSFTNFTALSLPQGNPSAIECSLYFCVKSYNTSVKDGITNEHGEEISSTWSAAPREVNSNMTITPNSCQVGRKKLQPPYPPGVNCTYSVDYYSFNALNDTLSDFLSGYFRMPSNLAPGWSSDTIEALYGKNGSTANMEQIITRVASMLTMHARRMICKTKVQGKALSPRPFLHVQWAWMSLPVALVCFTLVFFITTVIRTRRDRVWKCSPLPLLYFGLTRELRESIDPVTLPSNMDDVAKGLRVQLGQTDEGLRLSRPGVSQEGRYARYHEDIR